MARLPRRPRFWTDSWSLEISAFVFALACYAAIVALLVRYNGHQVFRWKYGTLNALISAFSTLAKSALALVLTEGISQWKWIWFSKPQKLLEFEYIDSASRGPLGSLRVLGHLRWRSLVSFGAFLTLLSLPLEPFVQQVIGTVTTTEFEPDNAAKLSYAARYSQGSRQLWSVVALSDPSGNKYQYIAITPNFGIQYATLYGLGTPVDKVLQQVSFDCPSGSCEWKPVQSLAVCSKCIDLTDQIKSTNLTNASPPDVPGQSAIAVVNLTRYSLPNKMYLDDTTQLTGDGKGHWEPMVMFNAGNTSNLTTSLDSDTVFWASTILRFANPDTKKGSLGANVKIQALECGLSYCVKEYKTTVQNGTAKNIGIDVPFTRDPDSWNGPFPKNTSTSFPAVSSLDFKNPYYYIPRTDLRLFGPDKKAYNLSQEAVLSISRYLNELFTPRGYVIADKPITYVPLPMQPLFDSPDLNSTFAALAASLTNMIRAGDDNSTTLSGSKGELVTRWHVRWAWLILPLVLLAATPLFLILTALATKRGDVAKLKSSSLAILKAGGQFSGKATFANVNAASDMEERAGQEKVQLVTPGSGNSGLGGGAVVMGGAATGFENAAVVGGGPMELRPMLGREQSEGGQSEYSLRTVDTAYSAGYPQQGGGYSAVYR